MANEQFPKKELETLWAPWRVEYFEKEPRDRNFLETAARASDDAEHLVIARRKNAFLMMNRYPYTVGHLMVVPYRKVAELSAFGENELVELWNLVVHAQALLRAAVKAQGFNIGLNLGECAAQVFPITCIFTSSRGGAAIRISCRSSAARACSRMGYARCTAS